MEVDLGGHKVDKAANAADDEGGPGLHKAGRASDGHQASQGAVTGNDQVPHDHSQREVLVGHGDEQGGNGA
jgi:hypothetical protein